MPAPGSSYVPQVDVSGDTGYVDGPQPGTMTEEQRKAKCTQLTAQIKQLQEQENYWLQKLNGPLSETERESVQKQLDATRTTLAVLRQESNKLGCSYAATPPPPFYYQSPLFCDVQIFGILYEKWQSLKQKTTADGQSIYEYLGSPLAGQIITPTAVMAQYFERGVLTDVIGSKDPHVVYGPIYLRYRRHGGLDSTLGAPTHDEEGSDGGGRQQAFEHGMIIWSPATGAYDLSGPILDYWSQHKSMLGWPLSGILTVSDSQGVELGQTARFQNAVVYYSPASGAHEVHGAIRDAYETRFGGPLGLLGFPMSDETDTPNKTGRYNDFERGVLVWHPEGTSYLGKSCAGVYGFTALDFFLMRVQGSGSDGWLNNSQELYIYVDIKASNNQTFYQRMPPSGHWGPGQDIQEALMGFDVVNGTLKVQVRLEGWDSDEGFLRGWLGDDDDLLGTIAEELTADNLWGTLSDYEHSNGDFTAAYLMRARPQPYDPSLPWRQQCFWGFHNWKTPELTWHQFASTFSDVAENEDHWLHPFNYLFYSWFYDELAAKGNCHGMCVESIYAQVGRSPFVEPIYQYGPTGTDPQEPTDHNLINEINIKHGYQLGDATIDYLIGQFLTGNTHDPNDVFEKSRSNYYAGNYPIIAMTPGVFDVRGHVVRPYDWGDDNVGTRTIRIANPNAPLLTTGLPDADDERCCIKIDSYANTFSIKIGDEVWSGGSWLGGRMYSIPFSAFESRPATPFWEVMALLAAGCLLVLGDDGRSKQLTDNNGRHFYRPISPFPTRWEHIVQDTAVRFPGLTRVPLLSGGNGAMSELYYFKDCAERGFTHSVVGRDGGTYYNWGLSSPLMSLMLRVRSPKNQPSPDTIGASQLHRKTMGVTITSPVAKTLNLAVQTWTGLVVQINTIALTPNKPFTITLNDCGKAIKLNNSGEDFHSKVAVHTLYPPNVLLSHWHRLRRSRYATQPVGLTRHIARGSTIIR